MRDILLAAGEIVIDATARRGRPRPAARTDASRENRRRRLHDHALSVERRSACTSKASKAGNRLRIGRRTGLAGQSGAKPRLISEKYAIDRHAQRLAQRRVGGIGASTPSCDVAMATSVGLIQDVGLRQCNVHNLFAETSTRRTCAWVPTNGASSGMPAADRCRRCQRTGEQPRSERRPRGAWPAPTAPGSAR